MLRADYPLADNRRIPLVAFAHPPADARSACIAVLDVATDPHQAVASCRPLAAPVVFTCFAGELQWWKQGTSNPQRIGRPILAAEVPAFFEKNVSELTPDRVYRAKTWGRFQEEYQLAFVDIGLMPLIEAEIGDALSRLIERNVSELKTRLGWQKVTEQQGHWLLQTVFWLASAKILRDKGVPTFRDADLADVDEVFRRVAQHYGTGVLDIVNQRQREALQGLGANIKHFSNLALATTESLAHVYENTLVAKETRREFGIHSTPTYLVDYVVGKLAPWIEGISVNGRNLFEPACGHAAFLVAGMRLLTELLPDDKAAPAERRRYLRPRVHGCEIDTFALEIARLSLTLADIPNADGWDLQAGDMFLGDVLERQARAATVLLANPPFQDFTSKERARYARHGAPPRFNNKTAEVLGRTLPHLPPGAVFGVVAPQGLLHGSNAAELRKLLANDFEIIEICLFPDRIFTFSDMESAVIIGRRPPVVPPTGNTVSFARVRERGVDAFKASYAVTSRQLINQARFTSDEDYVLRVPELADVWEWCRQNCQILDAVAELGKGLDYHGKDLPQNAVTYSFKEFPGAVPGFVHFTSKIQLHQLPREYWLNLLPEVIRRPGTGTTTGRSQILLNYARVSRGPWRMKALIDAQGHPVTSRFITVRPRTTRQPLDYLWAIMNSPIANAFAYTHLAKRDNLVGVIRQTPIPKPGAAATERIVQMVQAYFEAVSPRHHGMRSDIDPDVLRHLFLRIDAEILRLYSLPPRLERGLLDLFSSWPRPGLPFNFDGYYPDDFKEPITYQEFLAITQDWSRVNERRAELIYKETADQISPEEQSELGHLQKLADLRIRLVAPLPLRELEQLKDELSRTGK